MLPTLNNNSESRQSNLKKITSIQKLSNQIQLNSKISTEETPDAQKAKKMASTSHRNSLIEQLRKQDGSNYTKEIIDKLKSLINKDTKPVFKSIKVT